MGYDTDFRGSFKLNKPLSLEMRTYLKKFNETRRMKRYLRSEYGIEGEFFVDGKGFMRQDSDTPDVINGNEPPNTQPSLWCQWTPSEDGTEIQWDGGEKFYYYIDWIHYIIYKFLAPNGYILNGKVEWVGEDCFNDRGEIVIKDNKVNHSPDFTFTTGPVFDEKTMRARVEEITKPKSKAEVATKKVKKIKKIVGKKK